MKDNSLAIMAVVGLGLFFLMRSKADAGNVPTTDTKTGVLFPLNERPEGMQYGPEWGNYPNYFGDLTIPGSYIVSFAGSADSFRTAVEGLGGKVGSIIGGLNIATVTISPMWLSQLQKISISVEANKAISMN